MSAGDLLEWYNVIRQHMSDFRPEAKSMSINFAKSTIRIDLYIVVTEGWRKRHKNVKIPASQGYKILEMRDDNFNLHKGLWQFADGGYVLAAKTLPSSEKYLVTLEGPIDRNAIYHICIEILLARSICCFI